MSTGKVFFFIPAVTRTERGLYTWLDDPQNLSSVTRLIQASFQIFLLDYSAAGTSSKDPKTSRDWISRFRQRLEVSAGGIGGMVSCHHEGGCQCCPPGTGLFEELADRLGKVLEGTPAIVHSAQEATAANISGARPVWVSDGEGMSGKMSPGEHPLLAEVVDMLISQSRSLS